MFKITKDYLATGNEKSREGQVIEEFPLYGVELLVMQMDPALISKGPTIPFRLLDDDDNRCYDGILTDDDECMNQEAALRFGEADVGATRIMVRRGNKWIQEIG